MSLSGLTYVFRMATNIHQQGIYDSAAFTPNQQLTDPRCDQRSTKILGRASHCLSYYWQIFVCISSSCIRVFVLIVFISINESIVFQPNSDIIFMGRERASWWYTNMAVISWMGGPGVPMILVQGPSKVTIMHLTTLGNYKADGIWVTNSDQPGARIYIEDYTPMTSVNRNIWMDGLDNLHVDVYPMYVWATAEAAVQVTGGPCAAQGKS
jgi:hypothetical protein